jgi:hypothetical protein
MGRGRACRLVVAVSSCFVHAEREEKAAGRKEKKRRRKERRKRKEKEGKEKKEKEKRKMGNFSNLKISKK